MRSGQPSAEDTGKAVAGELELGAAAELGGGEAGDEVQTYSKRFWCDGGGAAGLAPGEQEFIRARLGLPLDADGAGGGGHGTVLARVGEELLKDHRDRTGLRGRDVELTAGGGDGAGLGRGEELWGEVLDEGLEGDG